MIEQLCAELWESIRVGGPVLWALILWGTYLFYLLFDTSVRLRKHATHCRELDCVFAKSCQHWQTVDLSCRYLRQDLLAIVEGRVRFLQLAVNTAPLLGLLGTVVGIFKTFEGLSAPAMSMGLSISHTLSDGISQALVTTQLGLIIAVPSFVWLRRIIGSLEEVEQALTCFEFQCHRSWQHRPASEPEEAIEVAV